jgi:hypothetical protein
MNSGLHRAVKLQIVCVLTQRRASILIHGELVVERPRTVDCVTSKPQNCVLIITVICINKLLFKYLNINVNKLSLTLINPYKFRHSYTVFQHQGVAVFVATLLRSIQDFVYTQDATQTF